MEEIDILHFIILLNGGFCAFYLTSVRRKHCVSTKTRFSNLKFIGKF
jgi:hypothetical protein